MAQHQQAGRQVDVGVEGDHPRRLEVAPGSFSPPAAAALVASRCTMMLSEPSSSSWRALTVRACVVITAPSRALTSAFVQMRPARAPSAPVAEMEDFLDRLRDHVRLDGVDLGDQIDREAADHLTAPVWMVTSASSCSWSPARAGQGGHRARRLGVTLRRAAGVRDVRRQRHLFRLDRRRRRYRPVSGRCRGQRAGRGPARPNCCSSVSSPSPSSAVSLALRPLPKAPEFASAST